MADIEERAEKWARECVQAISLEPITDKLREILAEAYLAGSAQTQADYVAYFCRPDVTLEAPSTALVNAAPPCTDMRGGAVSALCNITRVI